MMTAEDNVRGAELLGRRNAGTATAMELEELSRLQSKALAEMRTRAESPLRAGEEFAPNAPAQADVPRPQLDGSDYLEAERAREVTTAIQSGVSIFFDKIFARIFGR